MVWMQRFFTDVCCNYMARLGETDIGNHDALTSCLASLQLTAFKELVKGAESMPGKYGNRDLLGHVCFSFKELAAYLADVGKWLELHLSLGVYALSSPSTSSQFSLSQDPLFAAEMQYLAYADFLMDVHKCKQQVVDASHTLLILGPSMQRLHFVI